MRTFAFTSVCLSIALLLGGCSKEAVGDQAKSAATPKTVEKQVEDLLFILDERNLAYVTVDETTTADEARVIFKLKLREDADSFVTKKVVCKEDNATRFARCVDAWMERNPGEDLLFWKEDGVYYADDDWSR